MPLYSFYPRRSDGCAATWLCAELEDDKAAFAFARGALAAHPSATCVAVLEGERDVAVVGHAAGRAYDERVIRQSRGSIESSLEILQQTAPAAARARRGSRA